MKKIIKIYKIFDNAIKTDQFQYRLLQNIKQCLIINLVNGYKKVPTFQNSAITL